MRYGSDYDRNFAEKAADEVRGWFGGGSRERYDHGLRGGYDRGWQGSERGVHRGHVRPMEHERTIRPHGGERVSRGADYDRGFAGRGRPMYRGGYDGGVRGGYAGRGNRYDRPYRAGARRYGSDYGGDYEPYRGEIDGFRDLGLRPGEYRSMIGRGRGGGRGWGGGMPGDAQRAYGTGGLTPRNESGLERGRYFKAWGVDQRP